MSTPRSSASGNIRPASMTMMSSPQRTAMQFMPNSPSPPRGTSCNFPDGIRGTDASTGYDELSARTRSSPLFCHPVAQDPPSLASGDPAARDLVFPRVLPGGPSSRHQLCEHPSLCGNVEEGSFPAAPRRAFKETITETQQKSWLRRRVETAVVNGLTRAYETVKVDPAKFLIQLRAAYDLPITSFRGMYRLELNHLDDVASSIIRSNMKLAAAQGAGFGLGGIITVVPDMGVLSAITMRTIQKLSLVYGFEFNTDEEM